MAWDPAQYLRFESERARPFHDLVHRIAVEAPARVVDLGCGPGNVTASLLDRWPGATVHGIDSSAEMIDRATALAGPRLTFSRPFSEAWRPAPPVDFRAEVAAGLREAFPRKDYGTVLPFRRAFVIAYRR